MSFYAIYPPIGGSLLPPGAATAANQLTQIGLETSIEANTASIDSKIPALGQAVMANSLPVAIASDQPALPVTGPLTDAELRATPVDVLGPLTDAELRASAVPVSGPLTDVQLRATPVDVLGPLTDTELRASAVAVSGPLTDVQLRATPVDVLGPLTDTELRATPVPVSGTISTNGLTDAELRATPVPVSLTSTTITGSVAVTGPLTDTQLRATPVPVSGTVSTGGLTDAELRAAPVDVTGPLTDAELRASAVPISAASLPLPSGAATEATLSAFSDKSSSADVVEAYDYRSIAYVGATQKIDTITYKTGGSGGTTVATQTFGYDGSDRLTSITKT